MGMKGDILSISKQLRNENAKTYFRNRIMLLIMKFSVDSSLKIIKSSKISRS